MHSKPAATALGNRHLWTAVGTPQLEAAPAASAGPSPRSFSFLWHRQGSFRHNCIGIVAPASCLALVLHCKESALLLFPNNQHTYEALTPHKNKPQQLHNATWYFSKSACTCACHTISCLLHASSSAPRSPVCSIGCEQPTGAA